MSIQPKLMGLSQMQAIIQPHIEEVSKHIFINSELAILHGNPQVFKLILSQQPPFLINDYRMGILVHGEICVNVNLVEKRLHEGTLVSRVHRSRHHHQSHLLFRKHRNLWHRLVPGFPHALPCRTNAFCLQWASARLPDRG